MKKLTKLLKFFLSIVLTLSLSIFNTNAFVQAYTINNSKLQLSKIQMNNLKNLGFSKNEIEQMAPKFAEKFKNVSGKVVSSNKKFIKLTKQYDSSIKQYKIITSDVTESQALHDSKIYKDNVKYVHPNSTDDSSNSSWLELETSISYVGYGDSGNYLYKTTFRWLTQPLCDLGDYIGTGCSVNVSPIANSEYFQKTYTRRDLIVNGSSTSWSDPYTKTDYIWNADIKGYSGIGFHFTFTDPSYSAENISGMMCFLANPNVPANIIDAYGSYIHQYLYLSPSVTFASSGFLSISPASGSSIMPNTHAQYFIN